MSFLLSLTMVVEILQKDIMRILRNLRLLPKSLTTISFEIRIYPRKALNDMSKKLLIGILLLGLSLRLGWVGHLHLKNTGLVFSDAEEYNQIATSFLGKRYDKDENFTLGRSCGYPLFIAGIYSLFGIDNLFAVRLFQALLGTFTLYFLFLIGKRIFNSCCGLLASFIASLNPYLIFYNGAILTETLFIFLITLMFYFLIKGSFLKGGIFAGLSFLTKESFVFYLPFLAIALWFSKDASIIKRIKIFFSFFILLFFIWGIWPLRNYIQLGRLSFREAGGFSQKGTIWFIIWTGWNPYIEKKDLKKESEYLSSPELYKNLTREEKERFFKEEAIRSIKERSFLEILNVIFIKFGRFWRLYPHKTSLVAEVTNVSCNRIKIISLSSDGLIILLGAIGFLLALPLLKKHLFVSLWIWGYCIGFVIFHYPMIRYRLPVMPFVMLFAGYTLFLGYKFFTQKLSLGKYSILQKSSRIRLMNHLL